MKSYCQLHFEQRIKWRIRGQWAILFLMLAYMIVIGEMGGGDSRMMLPLAEQVSRIIFFGGMGYIIYRLIRNYKLLKDKQLLKEKIVLEQDERRKYLHDKSGGIIWDIQLIFLLFLTLTASLYNMHAFYALYIVLVASVLLKIGFYLLYYRKHI